MRNSLHDGEGPDWISSEAIAGRGFSSGEPSLERPTDVRADTGKRGSESTFVHFRQLFQEGGTDLPSLHITGKNGHTARVREMREGEAHFQFFPVYGAIWRKARFSRIKKRPLSSTDEEKARLSVGAHPPPLI